MKIAKCLLLLALLAGVAGAQPRVVDLRGGTANWFGNEHLFDGGEWLTLGEISLRFVGARGSKGPELFRFEADTQRIERLATFCPGQAGSFPVTLLWQNDHRALLAVNCQESTALWVTDGTIEGSRILLDGSLTVVGVLPGDRVVFWRSETGGLQLWITDATASGTMPLAMGFTDRSGRAHPGWQRGETTLPQVVFWASHPTLGVGLWRTDGTAEGTRFVPVAVPGHQDLQINQVGRVGDRFWFTSDRPGARGLWVTDGTSEGTRRILESLAAGPHFSSPVKYEAGPTKTYFFAPSTGRFANDLRPDWWVTDGTQSGTLRLTRSLEGEEPAEFGAFNTWRDRLFFFFSETEGSVSTLWRSDGTIFGTGAAHDVPLSLPGTLGPNLLRTPFGLLIVAGDGEPEPRALWIVDDQNPQLRMVATGGWNLSLPVANDFSYLTANAGFTGEPTDLWRTDGTPNGTQRLGTKIVNDFPITSATTSGRLLWFLSAGIISGPEEPELWQSDGSANGTRRLTFPDLEVPLGSSPRNLKALGDRVVFELDAPEGDDDSNDPVPPERIYSSDGSPAGTADFVDFPPGGPPIRRLSLLVPLPGGRVLFHVDDSLFERPDLRGFWSANGQPGGTLKASAPGEFRGRTSNEFWPTADGALVASRFFLDDGRADGLFRLFIDGRPAVALYEEPAAFTFGGNFVWIGPALHVHEQAQLIRTDGTLAGTRRAFELGIRWSVSYRGQFVFADENRRVWSYDGESPPVAFGGDLDLLVDKNSVAGGTGIFGTDSRSLFYFDGTRTRQLASFSRISGLTPFQAGLAFVAEENSRNGELWFSDGTTAGTRRVADLWPGPRGSFPEDLQVVGDRLFFTAHNGTHGRELWSTDGTAAGTVMYDVNPGVGSSVPGEFTVAGGKLFFSGYDDTHGRELWSLDLGDGEGPPPPAAAWLASPAIPGFRFQVRIGGATLGRLESGCLSETVCVSGAVAGRPEVFLRVVGPRGNGFLWPTLVKFTTSDVEIWIEQTATGVVKYYQLAGARPGVDELPARFDRLGFRPASAVAPAIVAVPAPAVGFEPSPLPDAGPPPPAGVTFFETPALPGFRVAARITAGDTEPPVRKEPACIAETLCLSGAVPGRSEVFVRLVGPKPNGFLWPTLARFTSSQVELWIEQKATGERQYYRLPAAAADSNDLTGLFDREGFRP